eukprot:566188-Pelagomonas_calceolata.AAC.4
MAMCVSCKSGWTGGWGCRSFEDGHVHELQAVSGARVGRQLVSEEGQVHVLQREEILERRIAFEEAGMVSMRAAQGPYPSCGPETSPSMCQVAEGLHLDRAAIWSSQ